MKNIFSLTDKIVLITGGYGHLGHSITLGLIDAGARVMVLGRSIEKHNKTFVKNDRLHFIECDVSSSESVKHSFSHVEERFGKIDVLINNAFYLKAGEPDRIDDSNWAYSIDGVLNSVHRCIREVLPYLRKNEEGRIINVSSMYGLVAPDFNVYKSKPEFTNPPHYGAAKAGVIQLTKYYASFLGKENILVNCVSPGAFPSKKVQEQSAFIDQLSSKTALSRIGHPKELQGVFVFLSSIASSYVTGQNIIVDGGWTIM